VAVSLPCPFGRYTLVAPLGRGGMAEIFLAHSLGAHGFERQLVIKRMHAHLSSDPAFTRMFIKEARLSARLVHANVVPVFDFGDAEGHLYLAMEYVSGVDLRPILKGLRQRNDPMPVEVACFIAIDMLRGLDFAHRLTAPDGQSIGVVHRDVSPSNILVSREGEVKVCDFGIALVASDHMTAAGTLKGKFAYMSPEQARGLRVDRRSDVFSVGLVLWEMLAAKRLYSAPDDVQTLILAQQAAHPEPPVDHAPNGEALGTILRSALAASPKDRYPSAAAFADELQAYLAGVGLVGSSGRLAAFLRERCAQELRRREQRIAGDEGLTSTATPSASVPSTFTSLPNLQRAWAEDAPEIELDLGEPEQGTGIVESPRSLEPPAGELPLWPPAPAKLPPPPQLQVRPPVVVDSSRAQKVPLLRHLLERGLLGAEQAEVVLGHAQRWACRISAAILAHRFVTESAICHALAEIHGLPTIDLATIDVSPRVFRRIPQALAEKLDVVAFSAEASTRGPIGVAIADPEVLASQRDIEFAVGGPIRPHIARYSAVTAILRRLYRGETVDVPPLHPQGAAEPASTDGDMVIERLDGESMVNTAVDAVALELDGEIPSRRRR